MSQSSTDISNIPQFSPRFELQSRIGRGAMGVVYKAYDRTLKTDVAVKLLLPGMGPDKAIRFQKEATTAARLKHENIVNVRDFGVTEKGDLYLIMDYLDGTGLDLRIEKSGTLELITAIEIFLQICSGLEHAHAHDILHRDIKPSNIMLSKNTSRPHVTIVDFGLAKLASDDQKLTSTGVRVGTPTYMSPEQARGEDVDARSDLYSLGCVMFFALAGQPPLMGNTYLETITMQSEEPPPRLNSLFDEPKYPAALGEIIDRLLSKDPEERYQTAGDLKRALQTMKEEVLFGGAVDGAPDSVPRKAGRLSWKLPLLISVIAIGIVCVFLASAFKPEGAPPFKYELHMLEHHYWIIVSGKIHGNMKGVAQLAGHEVEPEIRMIIRDPEVNDADLKLLKDLPLFALDLSNTSVSNHGVMSVASNKHLQTLILNNNKQLTDQVAYSIVPNLNIHTVALAATGITDDGVETISRMRELWSLDISRNQSITGKSLESLTKTPRLVALRIGETGIKGSDLLTLARFKKLRNISLAGLDLTDEDIVRFDKRILAGFDFSNNRRLTDKAIKFINPLQHTRLNVIGCPKISRQELTRISEGEKDFSLWSDFSPYVVSEEDKTLPAEYTKDFARTFYDPVCIQMWHGGLGIDSVGGDGKSSDY